MYTHLTYFANSTCKSLFLTGMVAIYTQVAFMFFSSEKYWKRCCFVAALIIGIISAGLSGFLFYLAFLSDIASPVGLTLTPRTVLSEVSPTTSSWLFPSLSLASFSSAPSYGVWYSALRLSRQEPTVSLSSFKSCSWPLGLTSLLTSTTSSPPNSITSSFISWPTSFWPCRASYSGSYGWRGTSAFRTSSDWNPLSISMPLKLEMIKRASKRSMLFLFASNTPLLTSVCSQVLDLLSRLLSFKSSVFLKPLSGMPMTSPVERWGEWMSTFCFKPYVSPSHRQSSSQLTLYWQGKISQVWCFRFWRQCLWCSWQSGLSSTPVVKEWKCQWRLMRLTPESTMRKERSGTATRTTFCTRIDLIINLIFYVSLLQLGFLAFSGFVLCELFLILFKRILHIYHLVSHGSEVVLGLGSSYFFSEHEYPFELLVVFLELRNQLHRHWCDVFESSVELVNSIPVLTVSNIQLACPSENFEQFLQYSLNSLTLAYLSFLNKRKYFDDFGSGREQ